MCQIFPALRSSCLLVLLVDLPEVLCHIPSRMQTIAYLAGDFLIQFPMSFCIVFVEFLLVGKFFEASEMKHQYMSISFIVLRPFSSDVRPSFAFSLKGKIKEMIVWDHTHALSMTRFLTSCTCTDWTNVLRRNVF